jgi:uncharacterized membrane protein
MGLLISGMIIFFGIHLVPALPLKNILIQRFGKNSYMGVFALIAALGLGLMIYGKSTAGFIAVWQPLAGAHWLPVILMWPAFVLLAWAEIPCSIKSTLRHPMLLGILLFSISHLFANGDLASILLLGSFGLYALLTMLRLGFKKKETSMPNKTPGWNLLGLAIGTFAYGVIFYFHQSIIGMPIPI